MFLIKTGTASGQKYNNLSPFVYSHSIFRVVLDKSSTNKRRTQLGVTGDVIQLIPLVLLTSNDSIIN